MFGGDSPSKSSPCVRQGQKRRRENDEERAAKRPPLPSSHLPIGENPDQIIGGEKVSHHSDGFNSRLEYDQWSLENGQWSAIYRDPYTVTYPDSAPFYDYEFASLVQLTWQQQVQPVENREYVTLENTQQDQLVNLDESYDLPGTSGAQYGPPSPIFGAPPSPVFTSPAKKAPEPSVALPAQSVAKAQPTYHDIEIFTEVTKSNALSEKKVMVTLGEVRRRVGAPEFQDYSMLSRLTRHAKHMRVHFDGKLTKYGLDFKDNNYSCSSVDSTIAMLLEDDAVTLAQDFQKLVSAEFSISTLASIATVNNCGSEIANYADGIIQQLLQARAHLLRAGRVPGAELEDKSSETHAVLQFSLETHGFGPLAAVAVVDSLLQVVHLIKKRPLPDKRDLAPLNLDPAADDSDKTKRVSSASAVAHSLLTQQLDDHNPFCEPVLPRIRYDVDKIELTVGEVRRRILGPEFLTPSQMTKFIRKAKITNSTSDVRTALFDIGMPVPTTRICIKNKDAVPSSSWSLLTELESRALAVELGSALDRLPYSHEMRVTVHATPECTACLRRIAASLADAVERVGYAVDQKPKVETAADMHILRFALITHHFGHNFYACVLIWLHNLCQH